MSLHIMHVSVLGLALGFSAVNAAEPAKDPTLILKKVTGTNSDQLSDFLIDQGTANVSAAGLAGVGATALTVLEDSKDFAVLLSPFSKDGKGGGFAVAPAKIRNPLPRIDLMTEYVQSGWWRAVAGLNFSGAQGTSEIGSSSFRRRAFAVSTSGYFRRGDDPIVARALERRDDEGGQTCISIFYKTAGDETGSETGLDGERLVPGNDDVFSAASAAAPASGPEKAKIAGRKDAKAAADSGLSTERQKADRQKADEAAATRNAALDALKACIAKSDAKAKLAWYLPRWSVALGTGDAQLSGGGPAVRTGTVFVAGVTYGGAWGHSPQSANGPQGKDGPASEPAPQPYGWTISLLTRYSRNEVVMKSLETATPVHQNTSLVVGRTAIGTPSWRLLIEASNNRVKEAAAGELTMQRALGLDYRVAKDSWLNVRYGSRRKTDGSGTEPAGLLSLTLGGDLLKF
jgi:hypothetical protein